MCSDLQEKELRFARAIDDAPFPIMIHAEDGTVHKTNRVWTELTGYDPSQIPTITAWTERAYGQRMAVAKLRIDRLYTHNRRVHEGEFELTTRSGDKRVWDFSSAPLGTTPDGKRLVLSMAVDITDRKAAEQARKHAYDDLEKQVVRRTEQLVAANETLRASEERLDLAVRGTSGGLWDADLETGRGYWSPRFKELLGYGEDEIEATFDEFLALLHPEDRADVREAIRLHLEENRPYDCEF
ncbi:MAG: PAS domain S-box protein [Planctomycetes bacterium]|nr:PAS domain S-box protein [Planctomycetota bacterium]